jgi:hypothetical protein
METTVRKNKLMPEDIKINDHGQQITKLWKND